MIRFFVGIDVAMRRHQVAAVDVCRSAKHRRLTLLVRKERRVIHSHLARLELVPFVDESREPLVRCYQGRLPVQLTQVVQHHSGDRVRYRHSAIHLTGGSKQA